MIDEDAFHMECIDEDDVVGTPYVDVRSDTIPHRQDDPDYSENPAALLRAAQWLIKAAEWLERRRES